MEQVFEAPTTARKLERDTLPEPAPRGARSLGSLLAFAGITAGVAALGSLASYRGTKTWYRTLRKPRFNPPDSVFGPVWTVLYGLIAVSGWRVYRSAPSPARTRALALWGTQLALNGAWSPTFFGAHRPRAALGEVVALLGTVGAYINEARAVDPTAAWMLTPYLGWTGFATLLNEEIVRMNGTRLALRW